MTKWQGKRMGMAIVGAITPYVDWGIVYVVDRRYLPDNTNYIPCYGRCPTHINHARSDTATSLILPNVKTIPYTLGALNRHQRSRHALVSPLMNYVALNQFRTFARGFDNVRQGDEIDVPLINSNSPEARNLKAMQMERDGKDPQMQVAEVAQQAEHF